jgi:hypothetical protein
MPGVRNEEPSVLMPSLAPKYYRFFSILTSGAIVNRLLKSMIIQKNIAMRKYSLTFSFLYRSLAIIVYLSVKSTRRLTYEISVPCVTLKTNTHNQELKTV